MSKVSEHIASEIHRAEAKHHTEMAKSKRARAAIFSSMHKEAGLGTDAQSPDSRMADALDHEADLHEVHAAHHEAAAKKCEKAAADAFNKLGDRIVPDQVQSVIRGFPTMVTRTGQPAGPQAPSVPAEFEHLIKVEEGW